MRCCTRVAGAQEGDISGLIKLTCVKAEHSTYFTAVSSFASILPCSNLIGISWFLESSFNVAGSSRRSIFKPTSRNGVFSQCSVISGTHYNEASGHLLTQWHDTHCSYVGFTHTNHPPTHSRMRIQKCQPNLSTLCRFTKQINLSGNVKTFM